MVPFLWVEERKICSNYDRLRRREKKRNHLKLNAKNCLLSKNQKFVKSKAKTIRKIREVINLCLHVFLRSVNLQPLELYNLQERYLRRKEECIFRKKSRIVMPGQNTGNDVENGASCVGVEWDRRRGNRSSTKVYLLWIQTNEMK